VTATNRRCHFGTGPGCSRVPFFVFPAIGEAIKTKVLGNSDLAITRIGSGAWAIVGARNAKPVDGIIGAMPFRLTPRETAGIER